MIINSKLAVTVFVMPCVVAMATVVLAVAAHAQPVQSGKTSSLATPDPRARIGVSADGNYGDADDWGATPLILSLIHHAGYKDRLVHYDYCSTMNINNPVHEEHMKRATLEGARRFGFDTSIFFNAHRDVDAAASNLAQEVNASSMDNKLVLLMAGPPEVLWQGINRSQPDNRKYVYVISHGPWNNYNNDPQRRFGHNWKDVIALGVNWVQIRDQNKGKKNAAAGFATGDMSAWEFIKRTTHGQWVYDWIDKVDSDEGKSEGGYRGATGDASDAGMAFYYFTGDQDGNVAKLKDYFQRIGASYSPPPESQGGWRKLEARDEIRRLAGMDPDKLDKLEQWLLASDKLNRDFAAVVIRRGYLVLEIEKGLSAKTDPGRSSIASCSKAICATVLAVASKESQNGRFPKKMTFDDPAFQFIPWAQPLSDPRKAEVKVKQLLNHTSGIVGEWWENKDRGVKNHGPWEWILGHSGDWRTEKLVFQPGADLEYSTHGLFHASLVCEDVTGMPYDQFAIKYVFEPIGIETSKFHFLDGDEKHGRHPSHFLHLPAREMARIAYCMLRDGRWGARQVIPKWFVDATGAPTHDIKGTKTFGREAQSFSHGWELPAHLTDGKGAGIPLDARFKPGTGCQLIAFVPSLDLVFARMTGSAGGEYDFEKPLRLACEAVLSE